MEKILFICTGNSARSIMAEALVNHIAGEKYWAYSAGAKPSGVIHPLTIKTLESKGIKTDSLRSKPLDEFRDWQFDIVITVCDSARESCPVWPRKTRILHWDIPDPAAKEGSEKEKESFFQEIFALLREKISESIIS